MALTMVPDASRLPDVLPSGRLLAGGKPVPELREELRRIQGARNALTVVSCWLQALVPIALTVWTGSWLVGIAAFFLVGRSVVMFSILGHEAAHRLLFRSRFWNDQVGRWLLSYPVFLPFELYRRGHFAHHRDELGPDEPDLDLYTGYPITRASLRRKLVRDATGISGWKILKGLLRGLRYPATRGVAARILAVQAVLCVVAVALGVWWVYPLLWFLPWFTLWRVLNRLRAIAEHAGMERSSDRRRTTHVVRQHWAARFWIVPYHTGWHLAHHVDMGVPWRNLPRLHRELEASGWVPDALEWDSYLALWRALSARPAPATSATGA